MQIMRNRYLLLIFIMVLTTALIRTLTYDTYHKAQAVKAIENIPLELGRWHGKDVPIEEIVYEILETKSIIHRTYNYNGQQVFLSIVYYSETKVDFHSPEGCLGGQGIQISKSSETIDLDNIGMNTRIDVNRLIWRKGGNETLVYYFYKAGEFLGQSYIRLRLNLAINKFSNQEKSGSLIRVSTPVSMSDVQNSSKTLVSFIRELHPFLVKAL